MLRTEQSRGCAGQTPRSMAGWRARSGARDETRARADNDNARQDTRRKEAWNLTAAGRKDGGKGNEWNGL
jgi:hypothetical protein